MKKTILIVSILISVFTISCSSDDHVINASQTSSLTATINGVTSNYNTISYSSSLAQDSITNNYQINGSIDGGTEDLFQFRIFGNAIGTNASYLSDMKFNANGYSASNDFTINITTNTSEKIEGSFSGELERYVGDGALILQVTDGHFVIIF